jgi:guanylate kinase
MKHFLFCGPSGSGKTTIVHFLLKEFPQLKFSVSATTRAMRPNETDGVDYHFLSVDDFKNKINQDAFIEWEEVYHNGFYGTLKSEVQRIEKENSSVIFDVDVEGGLNIKKHFGNNLLTVFVRPPSVDDLKKRLVARNTETAETLQKRLDKSIHELTYENLFDHIIINHDLEEACIAAKKMVQEFLAA